MSEQIVDPLNKNNEPYPVHKTIKVLKAKTLFKNQKWWEAVLLIEETFNERTYKKIVWYRWIWKKIKKFGSNEEYMGWSRKEHKGINFQKNWNDAKPTIDEFAKELT